MGNTFHLSQLATQGNSGVSIEEHNTPNVSITSDVLNENFIDIDNISRQYFQLMIKLHQLFQSQRDYLFHLGLTHFLGSCFFFNFSKELYFHCSVFLVGKPCSR